MKKFTVLIVDDNENNRFTLSSVLSGFELDILEAKDSTDALRCLLRQEIHLIFLDIQLPDIDGFELAHMIKSRKSTMDIPIIFITAIFKSDEFMSKGYTLGAVDYIMKPFNPIELRNKLSFYMTLYHEKMGYIESLKEKNNELQKSVENLLATEDQLEKSEANWRLLGENIPYLIEVYNASINLVFSNDTNTRQVEYKAIKENENEYINQIQNAFESKETLIETYNIKENHKIHYVEVKSIIMWIKDEIHCMMMAGDVTKQFEDKEAMKYISYHDQLTGLRNRYFFRKYLENMEKGNHLPISIIMADVNGLKMINDSFGHQIGDELIVTCANILLQALGSKCVLARWGGDEFIALLPKTDHFKVERVMKKIGEKIANEKLNDKFPISIALGDATRYEENYSFEDMIKEAEDKMYVNKIQSQSSFRSKVMESLKNALFESDYETEEHTSRISEMAMIMANELNLPQNDKDKLVILGMLHDIGKIAIPSHVLNSMKPLTNLEWNSIRRHPEIGFRICSSIPELATVADLILSHHERWDGKGYPRGLKEKEIPLLARLITILDSFDVITHDRPYKRKQSEEYAINEIERCSGTQFDPNLVTLFVKVYHQFFNKSETNLKQ